MGKGQSSLEYLLILGGIIAVAGIAVILMFGFSSGIQSETGASGKKSFDFFDDVLRQQLPQGGDSQQTPPGSLPDTFTLTDNFLLLNPVFLAQESPRINEGAASGQVVLAIGESCNGWKYFSLEPLFNAAEGGCDKGKPSLRVTDLSENYGGFVNDFQTPGEGQLFIATVDLSNTEENSGNGVRYTVGNLQRNFTYVLDQTSRNSELKLVFEVPSGGGKQVLDVYSFNAQAKQGLTSLNSITFSSVDGGIIPGNPEAYSLANFHYETNPDFSAAPESGNCGVDVLCLATLSHQGNEYAAFTSNPISLAPDTIYAFNFRVYAYDSNPPLIRLRLNNVNNNKEGIVSTFRPTGLQGSYRTLYYIAGDSPESVTLSFELTNLEEGKEGKVVGLAGVSVQKYSQAVAEATTLDAAMLSSRIDNPAFGTPVTVFGSRFGLFMDFKNRQVFTGTVGRNYTANVYPGDTCGGAVPCESEGSQPLTVGVESGGVTKIFPLAKEGTLLDNISADLGLLTIWLEGFYSNDIKIKWDSFAPFKKMGNAFNAAEASKYSAPIVQNFFTLSNSGAGEQEVFLVIETDDKESVSTVTSGGTTLNVVKFHDRTKSQFSKYLTTAGGEDRYITEHFKSGVPEGEIAFATDQPIIETENGFKVSVVLPPASEKTIWVGFAGFNPNGIIDDISGPQTVTLPFYYTTGFSSIEDVVKFGYDNRKTLEADRTSYEQFLLNSDASPEMKWISAQSVRNYFFNSWLLSSAGAGGFRYFVWEGAAKCCSFISTVDVAHEYGYFELKNIPWALKAQLDMMAEKAFGSQASLSDPSSGKAVQHDLGHALVFYPNETYGPTTGNSQVGESSMPLEENANYLLLLYAYWRGTGDLAYIQSRQQAITDVVGYTMNNSRQDLYPLQRGITTFDGDAKLSQTPGNSYLAVKQVSAFSAAEEMLRAIGNPSAIEYANLAHGYKIRGVNAVKAAFNGSSSSIPLFYNPPEQPSVTPYSIALGEGLFYLERSGSTDPDIFGSGLVDDLFANYRTSYGNSKDAGAGVIRMTSDQISPMWVSKVLIEEIIFQDLYGYAGDSDSIDYAYNILVHQENGYADDFKNSGYSPWLGTYPRGAITWAYIE